MLNYILHPEKISANAEKFTKQKDTHDLFNNHLNLKADEVKLLSEQARHDLNSANDKQASIIAHKKELSGKVELIAQNWHTLQTKSTERKDKLRVCHMVSQQFQEASVNFKTWLHEMNDKFKSLAITSTSNNDDENF